MENINNLSKVGKSKLNSVRLMLGCEDNAFLCKLYEYVYTNDDKDIKEFAEYYKGLIEMVYEVIENHPLSKSMVNDFIFKEIARRFYFEHNVFTKE